METTYGTAPPAGTYRSLDFKQTELSAEQPLGEDPLLGRGRNAQDPYRGLITDEGSIEIPLDLRGIGFWLNALFGAPTTTAVAATGSIAFSAQPDDSATITIDGIAFTFVTASPGSTEILIGTDLAATLTAAATKLNASANPLVSVATYASDDTTLSITHDAGGPAGNALTLAAYRPPATAPPRARRWPAPPMPMSSCPGPTVCPA